MNIKVQFVFNDALERADSLLPAAIEKSLEMSMIYGGPGV